MKRIFTLLMLFCGLRLLAADATIANAPGGAITTVPDAYRMPWENPAVQGYYIRFDNLTNQVLAGMASQAYANTAANAATNGYPWGVLYDPVGTASGKLDANGGIATNLTIKGNSSGTNRWTYSGSGVVRTNDAYALYENSSLTSTGITFSVVGSGNTNALTLSTNGQTYGNFTGPLVGNVSGGTVSGNGGGLTNISGGHVVGLIPNLGTSNSFTIYSPANWIFTTTTLLPGTEELSISLGTNVIVGIVAKTSGNSNSFVVEDLYADDLFVATNISVGGIIAGNGSGLTSLPSDASKLNANGGQGTNNIFWGNSSRTNAVYITGSSEVFSNGVGQVTISGGNIVASNVTAATFTGALAGNSTTATSATTEGTATSATNLVGTTNNIAGSLGVAGNIYAPLVSFSAPSITFSGSANSGLYCSTAGTFSMVAVGARVAGVSSAGISMRANGSFFVNNTSSYSFSSSTDPNFTSDTTITRASAGVVQVNSSLVMPGTLAATNGVMSKSRNLLAPVSISVTGSPFNWTNSLATNNISAFIDGAGVTGTVGLNGTTIFSSLAGADATVPLQPGEYITVTYTIGTPVMFWKPF